MIFHKTSLRRYAYVLALCLLTAVVFGLCLLSFTCNAAPIHIPTQPGMIRTGMIRPLVKDLCVEGVLYAPIFVEGLQYPGLSLGTLQVAFAIPAFTLPWGHMLTTGMTLGRQRIGWGPGISGELLLSDQASLDGLIFQLGLGEIDYTQIHAARDFASGKWLFAHRLEGPGR